MVLENQVKSASRIELCKSGGLIGVNEADLAVDNLEPTFLLQLAYAYDREVS